MKCTLMHKHRCVAELELDDATGFIRKTGRVFARDHLPVGVPVCKGVVDRAELNEWWTDRSIPASRSGIREALEVLEIQSTQMLFIRCYGLSLSDQYWIRPEGLDITWEEINFFTNEFSDDIGDVLFGEKKKENAFNFSSPDNTSDGNLKKRWKIIDGKRCLVKGGSNPYRQQPLNEVIAHKLMDRLNIPHIPYTVMWSQGVPYSVCEDFIDENTELIPAWRIFKAYKRDNSTSVYQHFVNCCEMLGIKDAVPFLDRMMTLDYIIANEDRHLNNFGVLRNPETLEWVGMAPIYDSGSSLGYDKVSAQIRNGREITCKPFKNHHEEQLKLVSSFDWIDFSKLLDIKHLILEVLSAEEAKDYMDTSRIQAISESAEKRVYQLEQMVLTNQIKQSISTNDDVEKDIAASYIPKM